MTWFINALEEIGSPTNVFTGVDVLIVLVLATLLCFIAAMVYKYTHDGISYSSSFVQTTVIFGVLVSQIMLIIGSNIARAFTLVGALSIIRFRNAIKETRDVGFIFFMMTIGMAVGTRFYLLAIILTLFVSALFIGMVKFGFGSKKEEQDEVLKIISSKQISHDAILEPLFNKYVGSFRLLNVQLDATKSLYENTYLIRFKRGVKNKQQLLEEIQKIDKDVTVSLFGTDHLVY